MTLIAHITDLHLLEEGHERRLGVERRRLAYLSFGRPKNADRRKRRARLALDVARRARADHLVITGDLTEDGLPAQFEVLADVLSESGWDASRVTLVPGNHDAYVDPLGFTRALEGPLRAFAATSTPGAPIALGNVELLPVSTVCSQSYTRSAGSVTEAEIEAAVSAAARGRSDGKAVVFAMHHPPRRHALPFMQWIDGLQNHAAIGAILHDHDHAHVLHGHTHVATDRALRPGGAPRIFSAAAVVDSGTPVRLYGARHGRLWAEEISVVEQVTLALA